LPCLDNNCPTDRHRRPAQWWGYYPALLVELVITDKQTSKMEKRIVLPCNEHIPRQLEGQGELAGLMCKLRRAPGRKDFIIVKFGRAAPSFQLPPPFPVTDVLYRTWGVRPPKQSSPDAMCQCGSQDVIDAIADDQERELEFRKPF